MVSVPVSTVRNDERVYWQILLIAIDLAAAWRICSVLRPITARPITATEFEAALAGPDTAA